MFTVYKITNLVNNKCYIGSSENVYKRWNEHKDNAYRPSSNSYNYPLQCAFRKYGEQNFKFEILKDDFKTRYDCEEYEHDMIVLYNSANNKYGYNQTTFTHGALTDPDVRETSIQKRSQKCAKVDFNENIIEVYDSYQEAGRANGYENSASYIRLICKGERSSLNGMMFRDIDEEGKVIHKENKPYKGRKKIIGINIENPSDTVIFNSILEASKLLPCARKSITDCVAGKERYSVVKGYIFRQLDQDGNIIPNQIDIEERIKEYNRTNPIINGERHTIKDWCKIYNISTNSYYERIKKGMDVVTALTTPTKGSDV